MTLFRQQFRAMLMGLVIWCVASALLAYATAGTVPGLVQQGDLTKIIGSLPPGLQSMLGIPAGVALADGFVSMGINKSLIIVVVLYAVLLALAAVTREVDRRTIDFLLAMPIQRTEILRSRILVMALNTGLQAFVIWATLCLGLKSAGITGDWGGYALIYLNVWLLGMAIGGITLLASLWIDDYSLGVRLFLGMTVGIWAMEFVLRAVDVSRWGRFFSPFSYVDPGKILQKGPPWIDLTILLVMAVVTIGLSFPVFERKQISV